MRKGSAPKKMQTRAKLMNAAVSLFLEKGYQSATTAEISARAGFTSTMFFTAFPDKESVLYELIGYMFEDQFKKAELKLGKFRDPALLYGMEAALQLHIAELNEALRDLYVTAYSLPTTSEYIYRKAAEKLERLLQGYLPDYGTEDFYELEIASAGVTRSYMARRCDSGFTMEKKISRYLEVLLKIYEVPAAKREQVAGLVLREDLKAVAQGLIAETVKRAANGFEEQV